MNDSIDKLKKKLEMLKTSAVSITLSKTTLDKINSEMIRINMKSRSKLIEMIMNIYFELPITEGEKEEAAA